MRFSSPEEMNRRGMYDGLRNKMEKEVKSAGGTLLEFRIENTRPDGNDTWFDFYVKVDVSGVSDMNLLKTFMEAVFVDLYDYDIHYHKGNVNYDYVGSPKKKGFFGRFFG